MITPTAVEAALSVAQQFDARAIVLQPQGGTPLAQLCAATGLLDSAMPQGELQIDPANYAMMNSAVPGEGPAVHDQLLDGLAGDIANAVAGHLNYAKNVVRPIIIELVEAFDEHVKGMPAEVSYSLAVVRRSLPEPLQSPAVVDLVREFQAPSYDPIRTYLNLSAFSAAAMIEAMATGAKNTDDVITTWAANLGEEKLRTIWGAVFTSEHSDLRFDQLIESPEFGLDAALAVFLVAHKLYDNPPEGSGMDLTSWNSAVAELRNQAALRCVLAVEGEERIQKSGALIEHIDSRQIVVNSRMYDEFLAGGGSDATLFGAALAPRPARYIAEITERAGEFRSLWEQYNRVLNARESNSRRARLVEAFRTVAQRVIANHMDEIFAGVVPEGVEVSPGLPQFQQCINCLNVFVDTLTDECFNDVWELCTRAVCGVAFPHTSAETILMGITRACADNVDIPIREAALVSLIEYVVDWMCDQMTVASA